MESEKQKRKPRFCETGKCACLLLLLVLVSLGAVVLVTFVVKDLREVVPEKEEPLPWWKKTIIYQVYPRSFQDTDKDGTGDIQGIIAHLDHFKYLLADTIWLSPFYKSPMKDFGYDVADYRAVDPLFGNMSDFQELIDKAHAQGLHVIVDFVPNHSSDQHEWFKASRANKTNKYRDYYIWADGKSGGQPPNNWVGSFGSSSWSLDPATGQYYYHNYLASQPDLNYRNPDVLTEMDNVLRFWLEKGVDGFRVDAITHLFEIKDISKDGIPGQNSFTDPLGYQYTRNLPEIFEVVKRWKNVLKEYEEKDGKPRLFICETPGVSNEHRMKYYKAGSVPFFFDLINADKNCGGQCFRDIVANGLNISQTNWPNFVIGNHDNGRIATRLGKNKVDAMNMLLLTLPGTPTTYYGEEIGMENVRYTPTELQDPKAFTSHNYANARDPERNPMQWNASDHAGFTTGRPWLRVHKNYKQRNVKVQMNQPKSTLNIYRQLALLRQQKAFQSRAISHLPEKVQHTLSYVRGGDHTDKYAVAINLGSQEETVKLDIGRSHGIVEVTTPTLVSKRKDTIALDSVLLRPGEGMVLRLI